VNAFAPYDPEFTTEGTEAPEAGRKGFRIRVRTVLSLRSVSVIFVGSVVKPGAVTVRW
jgi:hypothetical protein